MVSVSEAAKSGDPVAILEAGRARLAEDIDGTLDPGLAGQLIDRLVRVQAALFLALDRAVGATEASEDEVEAARKARAERRKARRLAEKMSRGA